MKRINILLVALSLLITAASCEKYDDSGLKDSISSLEGRVEALEKLNSEVESLKQLVQGKVFIVSTEKKDGKYSVVLSDGSTLVLYSADNDVPFVTMVQTDGQLYWACYVDGKTEVLESDGKPLKVESSVTPQIRIRKDGYLEISADGGNVWIKTDAQIGTGGIFSSVEEKEDCLVLTFMDGVTEYVVPLMKEQEVEFVSFVGPQYFTAGQTLKLPIEMIGIDAFTITEKPEGWKANLVQGELTVTAPSHGAGDESGYIKMLGVGEETKIAQVYVNIGKAPCLITIDGSRDVTIKPNPSSCFYGACLMSEFDAKAIAQKYSGLLPQYSREPFTASTLTLPLTDLVGEIVDGERYVVWAVPVTGEACSEKDVLYQAVSSVGVISEVSRLSFEDALINVRVKGTETYYLIPMEGDLTVDDIVSDLSTYERNMHTSAFQGWLSEVIDNPIAGMTYEFLIVPVKFGTPLKSEAETFSVKLNPYQLNGNAALTFEKGSVDYKWLSVKVAGNSNTYKTIVATVGAEDYVSKGYSDDSALLKYLSSVTPSEYTDAYTFTARNLESGSQYWILGVALDENGVLGNPVRIQISTNTILYSDVVVSLGNVGLSLNSATIPLLATGGEVEKYRYMFLSPEAGGYWYNLFSEDEVAAQEALIYGTSEYTEVSASKAASGLTFTDLVFGTKYLFCVIGYDKYGKITNLAKAEIQPTVGKVVADDDEKWIQTKPNVSATIFGNVIRLNIVFPVGGFTRFVVTMMSSEEYSASMPSAARQRTDYVLGHGNALTFTENLDSYQPDWYIGADKPYLLIIWEGENGWYEPLVYNTATGTVLN